MSAIKRSAHSLLFGAVCIVGAASAVGLTVHEARHDVPVRAEVTGTSRDGLVTVARVSVRNGTGEARCALVRVVARDRDGRDLGAAQARPVQLAGHGQSRFEARVTLSAQQYRERLTQVRAVVDDCPREAHVQK